MKTIGVILSQKRKDLGLGIEWLEKNTKIKSSFIRAIENEDWSSLPPFPITLGFVKSLAGALRIDEKLATATLKRDYPPKIVRINPKPDVASKFFWGPRKTFALGVFITFLAIFGYLFLQYLNFVSPPKIYLESPKEGQLVVSKENIIVFGITDNDVKIVVNNQPVLVMDDGKFSVDLQVSENTQEIVVIGTSRSGKETVVRRKIVVQ